MNDETKREAEVVKPEAPKPAKKQRNRKAYMAVGGLLLALLLTLGLIFGSQKKQETYNGGRDILRMLETASGI